MSQKKYRKKTKRSRRNASTNGSGRIVSAQDGVIQLAFPIPQVLAATHGAIESLCGEAGLLVMKALIDDEVSQRAGDRYAHDEDCDIVRWGQEEGYVVFGGKKVPIRRPRIRQKAGGEVELSRYRMFQSEDRMEDAVSKRVVRGVSTRNYEGVIDDICDGYGVRKSSVSRHLKASTAKELAALMERPLGGSDFVAIMIDGISFHDYLLVAALGVDSEGKKHILGLWDGATENSVVVKELLEDLVERGLNPERRYLFVIDGAKALKKAIVSVFGQRAEIQRCQIHKERNVLAHLPDRRQAATRRALRAAWGMKTEKDALKALKKLASNLEAISPGAAASLKEGMEETITLQRLGVPDELWKTLRSTNLIEGTFARTRELCRNVKRWSNANMALRWASAMLLYAEGKFRRVRGHRKMQELLDKLKGIDKKKSVA